VRQAHDDRRTTVTTISLPARWRPHREGEPRPVGFYVYRYVALEGGVERPIYFGKGKARRALSHLRGAILREGEWRDRPDLKAEILRLHRLGALRIDVLACGWTEDQCYAAEAALIASYGRLDDGSGILLNVAKGGKRGVTSEIARRASATRAINRASWSPERIAAHRATRKLAALRAAATRAERRAAG
jgi:hypothetical protein